MFKLFIQIISYNVTFFWMKLGRVNNANEGGAVQRPLSEVNNNLTLDIHVRVCTIFREALFTCRVFSAFCTVYIWFITIKKSLTATATATNLYSFSNNLQP